MRFIIKSVWALAGCVFALAAAILAVALVQAGMGAPVEPRLLPPAAIGALVGGIVGWRIAPTPAKIGALLGWPFQFREVRLAVAFSVPWMLSVAVSTYAFRLFSGYTDESRFYALLLAPPAIFLIGSVLFRWASKPSNLPGRPLSRNVR